jgi:hypothetical protein
MINSRLMDFCGDCRCLVKEQDGHVVSAGGLYVEMGSVASSSDSLLLVWFGDKLNFTATQM